MMQLKDALWLFGAVLTFNLFNVLNVFIFICVKIDILTGIGLVAKNVFYKVEI